MTEDYSLPAIVAELVLNLAGLLLCWHYGWPGKALRRQPQRLTAWNTPASDFLVFLGLVSAGGFTVGSLTGALLKHVQLDSDLRLLLGGGAMEAGVLAGAALYFFGYAPRVGRTAGVEPDPLSSLPPPSIFLTGAATFLISLPILNATSLVWQGILKLLGLPVVKQDMVDLLMNTHSSGARLLLVVLAGLGAPLMEEILFRAGLFRFLRTRLPRWAGYLFPALVFGAAHLSLAFFVPLTVLGLIFSAAYERTGRIGTTIVAHGLFNLNTILMVLTGFGS